MKIKIRETWLQEATKRLRPLFKQHGHAIPTKIMVGCGWPRGAKAEVIGQCFAKSWTEDSTTHIFISPTQANDIEVLAILVHELVHAAVGCEEGHKGKFKTMARSLGLEGKLTATTVSPKLALYPTLKKISKELGKYPHSRMSNKGGAGGGSKRDKWPRLLSRSVPGYALLISPKMLEEHGYPVDPNGIPMYKKGA